MSEKGKITQIVIRKLSTESNPNNPNANSWDNYEEYWVGHGGVTEIKEAQRDGSFSHIPYVEVWTGESILAEFCMHNILGVYYSQEKG